MTIILLREKERELVGSNVMLYSNDISTSFVKALTYLKND